MSTPDDIQKQVVEYFVKMSLDTAVDALDGFLEEVCQIDDSQPSTKAEDLDHRAPVGLIGLGRCGSSIAANVAAMVVEAGAIIQQRLNHAAATATTTRSQTSRPRRFGSWVGKVALGLSTRGPQAPLILVQPLIVVGDLDLDLQGRVDTITPLGQSLRQSYKKLVLLDFSDVHTGGAGHHPISGQYLGRLLLRRDSSRSSSPSWQSQHAYLIDTVGLTDNPTSLFFFVFSAGGGTGSGMASEFGLAQQFARQSRVSAKNYFNDSSQPSVAPTTTRARSTPFFSCGIAVLPERPGALVSEDTFKVEGSSQQSQVLNIHANAGRLLLKYISEEYRASDSSSNGGISPSRTLRPFNMMMLVSNDIMKYAAARAEKTQLASALEAAANDYVAKQIFNIMTARADVMDYGSDVIQHFGSSFKDTIRLDPGDLSNSLAGPVIVGYAEQAHAPNNPASSIDMRALVRAAVGIPRYDERLDCLTGISILPESLKEYQSLLQLADDHGLDKLARSDIFSKCVSLVTILSIPHNVQPSKPDVDELKAILNEIFPKTRVKRFAFTVGATEHVSLTLLISRSGVLSEEVEYAILAYLKQCFSAGIPPMGKVEGLWKDAVHGGEAEIVALRNVLLNAEDPSKVIISNWSELAENHMLKCRELLPDLKLPLNPHSLLLTQSDVADAVRYLQFVRSHDQIIVKPQRKPLDLTI